MNLSEPKDNYGESGTLQQLIELRLKARLRQETLAKAADDHPDEDMVNALVEGRLEDNESAVLISHLVGCAPCLHLTSELLRAEPEMDQVSSSAEPAAEPGPLRRFLDRVAGSLAPSIEEDAVFAYGEKLGPDNEAPEPDPESPENGPK